MIRGMPFSPGKIVEVLGPYISDERAGRLREVVKSRTRSVVTVVEGIANYGNVSAVMRTAEGLGFFEIHIIADRQPYKHSRRTSQGAEKWMDVGLWDNSQACVGDLRKRGYHVAVTDSSPESMPLSEIDFTRPTAVVFGNEVDGVSTDVRKQADVVCRIDINGFVESYNISVAAALVLYHAYGQRLNRLGGNGDLSASEQTVLVAQYFLQAVQHAEQILLEDARRAAGRR
jgi:tRNA (guanosine-2'-O-)-methyltransferase